ncbi:MAG: disulfide bond formation protein DsbD [Alphaproteobacteria bacterium]|nr:disulfide bond formation protein DsbD [Alphaproteobacteria bacterium]
MIVRLLALLAFLAVSAPSASARETPEAPRHVQLRLVPESTTLRPGGSLWVAIEQQIEPQWHTYWENPGDSGSSPRIEWDLPEGLSAGPLLYPVPEEIPFGPLVNYGYEGRVVLLQEITAAETIPAGPLDLFADIQILVCHDICIPEGDELSLTLNDGPDQGNPRLVGEARAQIPVPVDWPATFRVDGGDFVITLTPADAALATSTLMGTVAFFPLDWGIVENTASLSASAENGNIILRQARGTRQLGGLHEIRGVIELETRSGDRVASAITARRELVTEPIVTAADTPAAAEPGSSEPKISWFQAIVFALLGGLILNLMPCVFPVLSIKALGSVKLAAEHPKLAAGHGFAYTLGILVTFTAIAALLIGLKEAGALIGWGFQLQNPIVVTLLSWLFFLIGLNLSGLFEIGGQGLARMGSALAMKQGLPGSFFTGVLATVVATPCTAPFMGAAMGFALTQPAAVALAVFLALGLGLALPFLALSLAPPLQRLLPRPGAWMETFRQFLAFPMFASSAWLIWVVSQQAGSAGVLLSLAGVVGIAFAVWLLDRRPQSGAGYFASRFVALLVILAVIIQLPFLTAAPAPATTPSPAREETSDIREPWTPEKLRVLLEGNDPVFVEMTAAWCITCKVNEKVALRMPQTRRFFEENGIRYLVGDWTNFDEDITRYLERYGRSGVPIYVFYGRRDPDTGERPEPDVLPQLLTPAVVTGTLSKGI